MRNFHLVLMLQHWNARLDAPASMIQGRWSVHYEFDLKTRTPVLSAYPTIRALKKYGVK